MRGLTTFSSLAVLAGMVSAALEPITVKGNAFFQGDKRWYIRGVDYQPGGPSNLQDPLGNVERCKRDIPLFKELGLNAVRVYTVDNSGDHDECMKLLEDAGIYLILDLNTPTRSINRIDPESTYNEVYHQHIFATVDVFSVYSNTALFFVANEVVNDKKTTRAATYVKAVTRDLKAYIKKNSKRAVPVGYSAADVEENRVQMAHYLNCGDDADSRTDFFAFNDYSWCGDSSFTQSGWDKKVETYDDYSVPIFFSEYGCNIIDNKRIVRKFGEVPTLYDTEMTQVFSGGLVYEFTEEANKFGLVEISKDLKSVTKLEDYNNLVEAFKVAKNPSDNGGYKENNKPNKCPAFEEGVWEANNTLPKIPAKSQALIDNGAGKPLGNPNTGLLPSTPESTGSSDTSQPSSSATGTGKSAAPAGPSCAKGLFLASGALVASIMFML